MLNSVSNNFLCLIIIFVSSIPALFAQNLNKTNYPLYNFENISLESGLSQTSVFDIIQDKQGFLWFATQDGLNRFDGYNFTVFRHEPLDTNTISDNFVNRIYEDSNGFIWVATNNGLNRFDPRKQSFKRYTKTNTGELLLQPGNDIHDIIEDNSGTLWFGTHNTGVLQLLSKNINSKKFNTFKLSCPDYIYRI